MRVAVAVVEATVQVTMTAKMTRVRVGADVVVRQKRDAIERKDSKSQTSRKVQGRARASGQCLRKVLEVSDVDPLQGLI